ncbi:MAG: glycosyltransferase family 4 protein [Acidobacteriota bacterium]|nr:glycosyltransferase family 4 protein [Acidobacteriota bacterium]
MKVLRFSHDYLVNTGGLMGHLRALNRALAGTGRAEVLQTFLVGESQMEALEAAGKVRRRDGHWYEARTPIRVFPCLVPMRTPGRTDMDSDTACTAFRRHLDGLLRRERPHLLHVHLVRHRIQVVALEAAGAAGTPAVITHHEGRPATPKMAEILRESCRLADRVCAVTRFSAAAFGGPRVDYRGFFVDRDFWNPGAVANRDRDAWRRRLAPGATDRLMVYPARFIPRKNHEFLIRGLHRVVRSRAVRDAGLGVRLALPGPTLPEGLPFKSRLEKLVSNLDLDGHVTFLETLSPADLRALYSAAQIVVYPARNEGAGRSHLEGMLLGCCPAVSGDGGLVEYVRHRVNGIVFSPNHVDDLVRGLESILLSDDLRRSLAAAARETAAGLTLDRYASDHLTLYRRLMDEKRA